MKFASLTFLLQLLISFFTASEGYLKVIEVLLNKFDQSSLKIVTILACERHDSKDILQLKKRLNIRGISTQSFSLLNATQVNDCLEYKGFFTHVVLDLTCNGTENFLDKVSSLKLFNETRQFVFIGRDLSSSEAILQKQNINVDTRAYLIVSEVSLKAELGSYSFSNRTSYKIFEVQCAHCRGGTQLHFEEVGYFHDGLFGLRNRPLVYDFESDIATVAFMIPKPPKGKAVLEYLKGGERNYQDNANKWGYRIGQLLADKYNFRMHMIKTNVYGFSREKDISQWPGITGMIRSGRANFSICPFSLIHERVPVIDNAFKATTLRQWFIFRHPKSGRSVTTLTNPFIKPISDSAWLTISTLSIFNAALFTFIHIYEHLTDNSFSAAMITTIAMLSLQDVSEGFRSTAARLSIIFFMFLTFVFQQFYSGSIVSTLLSPVPRSIRDMPTLINSDLKVVLQDVPTSQTTFLIGPDETGKVMWRRKVKDIAPIVSVEEGVKYIQRGGYAFFGFVDHTYDVIKRKFTAEMVNELQEIKTDFNLDWYLPIEKHSPYKEPLRVGVLKIKEYGINDYLHKNWTVPKPTGYEGRMFLRLGMAHFSTLFLSLGIVYVSSGVILGGEWLYLKLSELSKRLGRVKWKELKKTISTRLSQVRRVKKNRKIVICRFRTLWNRSCPKKQRATVRPKLR